MFLCGLDFTNAAKRCFKAAAPCHPIKKGTFLHYLKAVGQSWGFSLDLTCIRLF